MNDSVNDAYTQTADWLVGTAKRNPEALLVLGAGTCACSGLGRSAPCYWLEWRLPVT